MLRLDINLLFTIINLLIWYLLIKKFLFKPVNNIIAKREEAIEGRYKEAEQEKLEAGQQKEKYEALQSGPCIFPVIHLRRVCAKDPQSC